MNHRILFPVAIASLIQFGCSSTQYFNPVSAVKKDSQMQQLADEDIKKAIDTKSQLVKPVTIAVYGGGASVNGFVDSLKTLDGVGQVVEISPGVVDGDTYYKHRTDEWDSEYRDPAAANIKQLRFLAAQGKADILIYCGTSHVFKKQPNTLILSYFLVLPALILHGYDVELSTNADLFCFDVRSGYLYGTYHDQDVYSKGATLISNTNPDKIKEKQIETMLPRLVSFVKEMLAQKKLFNGK